VSFVAPAAGAFSEKSSALAGHENRDALTAFACEHALVLFGGNEMPQDSGTTKAQATNIDAVVRLEAKDEDRVSHINRLSEAVASFAGTNVFILLQLLAVALWVSLNSGTFTAFPAYDPYPFSLLSVIMSLEGVLLTAFVLIRQNRMSERADRRSHLDLQINLLAEKEATKAIQLLQRMSRHLGIEDKTLDPEVRELSKDTAVERLARELRDNLDKET
jgi:uncharacterized membrane protein